MSYKHFLNIYIYTISSTEISSVYTIKYPYFVNLSIMTSIMLYIYPIIKYFNFSNFIIKSYNITSYSLFSISTGYSSLYGLCLLNLFLQQFKYFLITSLTKFYIFLIIYSSYSLNTNTIALLCFCISSLQNLIINSFIMSPGIYIALSYISYPLQSLQSKSIFLFP